MLYPAQAISCEISIKAAIKASALFFIGLYLHLKSLLMNRVSSLSSVTAPLQRSTLFQPVGEVFCDHSWSCMSRQEQNLLQLLHRLKMPRNIQIVHVRYLSVSLQIFINVHQCPERLCFPVLYLTEDTIVLA